MGGVAVVVRVQQRTPLDPVSIALFILVAIVAGYVAWRRPAAGIGFLAACEPFDFSRDAGAFTVTLGKVALLGVLAALAVRRPPAGALLAPGARPVVLGALAIAVVTALGPLHATYAGPAIRETLKALEYLAILGAAAVAIRTAADETLVLRCVALTALVVSSLALSELAGAAPSGLWIAGHVLPRIAGPLEGPNQLAGYLDLAVPIVLVLALVDRDRVCRTVLPFVLAASVFTLSRGGLLGLAAGIAVVFVAQRGRISRNALSAAGALAGMVVLVAIKLGVVTRFFSISDGTATSGLGTRSQLWSAAIALWRRAPVFGVGPGNYELLLPQVGLQGVRTHANSLYLQSLSEGGIVLLAAVVWTFVAAVRAALMRARRSSYLLGFGAAAVAFALHQVFDDMTFFPKVGTLWWLLCGLAVARIAAVDQGTSSSTASGTAQKPEPSRA